MDGAQQWSELKMISSYKYSTLFDRVRCMEHGDCLGWTQSICDWQIYRAVDGAPVGCEPELMKLGEKIIPLTEIGAEVYRDMVASVVADFAES